MVRPPDTKPDSSALDKDPTEPAAAPLPAPIPVLDVPVATRKRILAFAVLIPLLLAAILYLLLRGGFI